MTTSPLQLTHEQIIMLNFNKTHRFLAILAVFFLLLLAIFALIRCFRCEIEMFVTPGRSLEKVHFLSCTNIRQHIVPAKLYNVKVDPTDVEGWKMYTVVNENKNAYIFSTVRKDRTRLIFYPRTSRPQDTVTVYFQDGYRKRKLFQSVNHGLGWSEIGMQHSIDLSCVGYGDLNNEVDIPLIIVLQGKWAQVWFKDDGVFF